MPEETISDKNIKFLFTEIGRGHPFYLDGIIESLPRISDAHAAPETASVFDLSRGLSATAWKSVRWLYHRGSSGGPIGSVYAYLRNAADYSRPSRSLKLLGRDIRKRFLDDTDPLIVAHPTLVGILRGRSNLIYQHGEIAVPPEAIVAGADTVFVPIEVSVEHFLTGGYNRDQIQVSGLCVEPPLREMADECARKRQSRYGSNVPLCGFYVSSGAEPSQHVTAIIESITSVLKGGGRAVIMARQGGRLHRRAVEALSQLVPDHLTVRSPEAAGPADAQAVLALYQNRADATNLTAGLFDRFDYFVAPAHERTHWALGLGLPMFVLLPSVGTFAPLNLQALVSAKVAMPLDEANPPSSLGRVLQTLREDGSLARMSRAGWGQYSLDGFRFIARYLVHRYGN